MQGVRRAELQLGEVACVIGLGLVGQLVVQLLVAAGVRVVGFDVVAGALPARRKQRARWRARRPTPKGSREVEAVVAAATGGLGADHVFLAAGGTSNDPVELAARLARDRGRVVDIGKSRLDLPWNAYYEKELDVRFSRSYGPGRYDDRYELEGIDYPVGYVRWTERRNLACFVDLVEREALPIELARLGHVPGRRRRPRYMRASRPAHCDGLGFLFEYPAASGEEPVPVTAVTSVAAPTERRPVASARVHGADRLRRRRQLRHVDAAAPPRSTPRVDTRAGRDDPSAVGDERAAPVRLRGGDHRRRDVLDDDDDRRRLRRDPAPLARRAVVSRRSSRQGGFRREAARADRSTSSTGCWRSSREPATTGSWSASTAASRPC